ncbi:hypothetical protein NDU88_000694 [Pleurodeles waltl]|uniref:Uncharacterized protein n=1 Tax=Pleurodeles waltl TaxID=8319 RepID=A0AAV7U696_PLEWA|nr:hypothetical protein NDU88_000694 [Pleurodeles waltl]
MVPGRLTLTDHRRTQGTKASHSYRAQAHPWYQGISLLQGREAPKTRWTPDKEGFLEMTRWAPNDGGFPDMACWAPADGGFLEMDYWAPDDGGFLEMALWADDGGLLEMAR